MTMTTKYRTGGELTNPVSDINAANAYLKEDDMTQYVGIWGDTVALKDIVFDIEWGLTSESTWVVEVITTRPLTDTESAALSNWISGQNSDGLGEGFEQQSFAEHFETDRYGDIDEDTYRMSSFDWETNPCTLEKIK